MSFPQGTKCQFAGVKDSEQFGIRIIYQELTLVPQMTVAENILLGAEPNKWDNQPESIIQPSRTALEGIRPQCAMQC